MITDANSDKAIVQNRRESPSGRKPAQPIHPSRRAVGPPQDEAAGPSFELPYLMEYTPEAMLEEIRRVAALVEHPVLSVGRFKRLARVDASTVIEHLGSWQSALQRAGLAHRFSGSKGPPKDRRSDESLLEAIREAAHKRATAVLNTRLLEAEGISAGLLRTRFGSVENAVKRAGFTYQNATARRTPEQLHDNLLTVWRHYGRAPSISEINLPPSVIKLGPYARAHRTWKRALTAFVERMRDDKESRQTLDRISAAAKPYGARLNGRPRVRAKGRHKIALSLRFKVLQRDRFRCVACGATPAHDPGCKLHVDHVTPFSKGGKTEIANLRTLCAACNLGRGARAEGGKPRRHEDTKDRVGRIHHRGAETRRR